MEELIFKKRIISTDKTLTLLLQQIELASKIDNYTFLNEIAIENFIKNISIKINSEGKNDLRSYDHFRNHINSLLSYFVYLFESNTNPNRLWIIHRSIVKFFQYLQKEPKDLETVISSPDMMQKVNLLTDKDFVDLTIICSLKLKHLQSHVTEFYKIIQNETIAEDNDILQSLCIKLRNSLYQDSINTSMVLNILSKAYDKTQITNKTKLNIFEKIYSQTLIHTLKNQNKHLMSQVLLQCPDYVFNDENLIKQIIDCFGILGDQIKSDPMDIYSYSLFCSSPKFIKFISSIRRKYLNFEKRGTMNFFDLRECFLLAVHEKKHFLREFIDLYYQSIDDYDLSMLPLKSQITIALLSMYQIINSYDNFSQVREKISKMESNLSFLFSKLKQNDYKDQTLVKIIEKVEFIFKFSDWCLIHINHNTINEKFNFRYEIIAQLMTGTSPLKILSKYHFFELNIRNIPFSTFQEEVTCDRVCDLIDQFDRNASMILKGFIVIRLIIFCILSKEKENTYFDNNQLQSLLKDIYPIEFRMEIIENLFSLLFLTKNDLKNDAFNSEDEDYLDETISNIKVNLISVDNPTSKKINNKSKLNSNFSHNFFICPNWLIPKLLGALKEILYKTNSDLLKQDCSSENVKYDNSKENVSINNENIDKLKNQINNLLLYINDAQFRYDVIKPDFQQICENQEISDLDDPSLMIITLPNDHEQNENTNCPISTSSDTDSKNQSNENSSLISHMLASYTQLLCYTLTENRLNSSRKIVRLFENELKDSQPYKELQMLNLCNEFRYQINNLCLNIYDWCEGQFSKERKSQNQIPSPKINEITSFRVRSSRIQSLLYEMLIKMDSIKIETKIIFMLDYALLSSPSMEIAYSILESVFVHNNNFLIQNTGKPAIIPDKIEKFVLEIQKFINNLSEHVDVGRVKMNEFLERSLNFSSFFDTQTFVDTVKTQIELCKWYFLFHSLLVDLEKQIENPDLSVQNQDYSNQLDYYYDQLMTHCPHGKYQYLKALYLYVYKVNMALVECRKRDNPIGKNINDTSIVCLASHFFILKQSPSAILCSMVIKSKISPKIIDDLAQIMKVNLIGVLCSVFCPKIPSTFLSGSNIEFSITELCQPSILELIKLYLQGAEFLRRKLNYNVFINNYFSEETNDSMNDSFQPIINQDVLNYFYSKCPVLVEILRLLHSIDESQISLSNSSLTSLRIFDGSPLIKWIDIIRKNSDCGNNHQSTMVLAFYARIPPGHNTIIKTLEYYTSRRDYLQIYKLLQYIEDFSSNEHQENFPQNNNSFHNNFQIFRNAIYSCLAFIKEDVKYIFQIVRDPKMKVDLILCSLDSFKIYEQTFYASRLIRLGLQSIREDEVTYEIDVSEGKSKLEMTLKQIEFYASIGQLTGLKTWKSAKNNLKSFDVLAIIKTKKKYSLAIDWYEMCGFENETTDLLIELLIYAYSESKDYISLKRLFQMFLEESKSNNIIVIMEKILNQAENLDLRTFLIDFLIQYYRKNENYFMIDQYERHKLGVEMVKLLSRETQQDYLNIVPIPFLLIEQLLMNSEIESLEMIINRYKLFKADELIEKYAQKSIHIELYDYNSFDGSDLTIISSESSQTTSKSVQFVMPQKIPSKDEWVYDTHCMLCRAVRFNMINRRHHCRRCGRAVCNSCSLNSLLIMVINPNIPVRVCDDCFNLHNKISTHSLELFTLQTNNETVSRKRTQWKLSLLDDSFNQNRRNEFTYESAPSVSLCLAILHLHSDKKKCCKFIIDKICAPLIESISSRNVDSTLLIEMIRSLLISTRLAFEDTGQSDDIERHNSSSEIQQLNLYLDRLDVIRMLINANYGSKEMIGYVLNNNIQKLQEKLLEAERFELTIDIAKKYGIDSSPIWKSWALICLKYFHFVEARQKFIRYFDQIKRSNSSEVQKTLKMIIETLVSINSINLKSISLKDKCSQIILGQFDFFTEMSIGISNKSTSLSIKSNSINLSQHLKPRILQEIVYYLETYGSKEDQLNFYVKHFYWKEAIECFLELNRDHVPSNFNQTPTNFLQQIFIPAQINGHLSELFAAIRLCDPQQSSLESCLIFTCKYLNKNNFYHSLYRVQTFMNDYLRAAITQINYFFLNKTIPNDNRSTATEDPQDKPTINLDGFELLCSRINHLEKARDYCNMYLHNIEHVKVKQGCLVVDKKEVFKQIRLIELQMDILKRFKHVSYPITVALHNLDELEHYLKEKWRPVANEPTIFLSAYVLSILEQKLSIQIGRLPYPPTLLEHDPIRKSLITAFIILYYNEDNKIEDGFISALPIIEAHQLEAELVYKMATLFLLAHHLEKNLNVEQIINDLKQLLTCLHSPLSLSSLHSNKENDDLKEYIVVNLDHQETPTRISSSSLIPIDKLSDDIIDDCIHFTESIILMLSRFSYAYQNQINFAIGLSQMKLSELKESLIKLIHDDTRRIEAYLHMGKLKLAYLLAASLKQYQNIQRVLEAARIANDEHYVKICEMWLKKNSNLSQQRP